MMLNKHLSLSPRLPHFCLFPVSNEHTVAWSSVHIPKMQGLCFGMNMLKLLKDNFQISTFIFQLFFFGQGIQISDILDDHQLSHLHVSSICVKNWSCPDLDLTFLTEASYAPGS